MTTPSFDFLKTPVDERQLLVEASAGTGKTFALTGLVSRLVMEGAELNKILVVTFTNAATDELKTRIRQRLREDLTALRTSGSTSPDPQAPLLRFAGEREAEQRLEKALLNVDEASVFTIHGFCQRVLQQSAFESGSPFEPVFAEDAGDLFDRAVADFLARYTYADPWAALLTTSQKEDTLRAHYREFYRYPDVRLEPDAPVYHQAVDRLNDAVRNLQRAWNERRDATIDLLSSIRWKKDSGIQNESLNAVMDCIQTNLFDAPQRCIEEICTLASGKLVSTAFKKTPAEKLEEVAGDVLLQGCEELRQAYETTKQAFIRSFLEEVKSRYDELRQAAGILTFDDLLEKVDDALASGSAIRDRLLTSIRSRWTHALIDEFQDTDPRQYRIFRTAFHDRPLVFVGDPKQAIYSFRGADLHAYITAKRDTERQDGGTHRYMLDRNWRSASKLVEAVNSVFSQPASYPFLMDGVPYEPVEPAGTADAAPLTGDDLPPLVWWMFPPLSEEARTNRKQRWTKDEAESVVVRGVVEGIKQLLTSGATIGGEPVRPSNIALLVRTNSEGENLQAALRNANIPAIVSKGGNIWASDEVADLEHLLRAFLRPSDRSSLCTALATTLWGYDATMIHAVRQDEAQMDLVRGNLARYQRIWRESGVLRALTQFIEDQEVTERLLALQGGERRLTNVRHALELLHEEESRHHRGPDELVQWLRTRESRKAEEKDAAELRLETDAEAMQIVTIHKSKGLQYDIVIAPFLWSAKEKHKRNACVLVHDGDAIVYDIGSEDAERRRKIKDAERLAEDLRLAYVAITRAVHRCYIVWGEVNQAEFSAPAYLLHGHQANEQATDFADRACCAFEMGKDAAAIEQSLRRLAEDHPDRVAVVDLPTAAPEYQRTVSAGGAFQPRVLADAAVKRLDAWSITSYSRLATGDPHEPAFPTDEAERTGFFAFATGRVAGSCLHEIIEEVDVASLPLIDRQPVADVERLVERKLKAFGLDDPVKHRGDDDFDPHREVMRFLKRLGRTRIPLADATLPELDPKRTLREWAFMVPVGEITPRGLSRAVKEFADEPIRSLYPQRLERLSQDAVNGYLTGIADFAFEHEGRWYVFDWKSTNLGADFEDYAPDRLHQAALDRHYVLQLLIYALGLHRYLQTRMPGYDFDSHIGGTGVVFLRGIDGVSGNGFYILRPPRMLIEALDEMLLPVPA